MDVTRLGILSVEGAKLGTLTIGRVVPMIEFRNHPGYRDLPMSSRTGTVRECVCTCGKLILINQKRLTASNTKITCGDTYSHKSERQARMVLVAKLRTAQNEISRLRDLQLRSTEVEKARIENKIQEIIQELHRSK